MKKCPECNKIYDDSWNVCLYCRDPLTDYNGLPIPGDISSKKILTRSLGDLKKELNTSIIRFAISVLAAFIIIGIPFALYYFIKNITIMNEVLKKLNRQTAGYVLGYIFIPFGAIIFPLIVLNFESKEK